jgi:imidazolonepropionase-like amidohydrolase
MDVLLESGQIIAIDSRIEPPPGARVIDAEGMYVMPGFVDVHVHCGGGQAVDPWRLVDTAAVGWALVGERDGRI